MKKSNLKRTMISAAVVMMSASLAACSHETRITSTEETTVASIETKLENETIPETSEASLEETTEIESESETDEQDHTQKLLEDITKLVNYRYEDMNLDSLQYISEDTKNQLKVKIAEMGNSEYYDITDLYDEYERETYELIANSGGVVDADGRITYPDGYIWNGDHGDDDYQDGDVQNTTEYIYDEYKEEAYGYATGKPPVGQSADGYPIDEDGHVVIAEDGEAGDPRLHDISYGDEVVWTAVSEQEAAQMDDEDNKRFLDIYNAAYYADDRGDEYLEWYREQVQAQLAKERAEASKNSENDDDDDDILASLPETMDREFYTSFCVKTSADGKKHYINWQDILTGYDKDYGRFDYTLFGAGKYISFKDTYIPFTTARGNEFYHFYLKEYDIKNDTDINLVYQSKNSVAGREHPWFTVQVSGTIKDGKFQASSIEDFTDFYVR